MKTPIRLAAPLLLLVSFSGSTVEGAVVIRSAGGDTTPASITAARDTFRLDLGGGNVAGGNGSFGGLRREINWDGTPAGFAAPNNLPANFFNSNSPRGVVFSTPGTAFEVSSANTDAGAGQPAAADFGDIHASYTATFGPFSTQRLFTMIGSNVMDVNFFLPGTATPAWVSGFGSVFTDVDMQASTSIEYFDTGNVSLGTFTVPPGTVGSESLSFLGVFFNAGERVGRVRITSGNFALGAGSIDAPATAGRDLVVMDDFIYSEPVPEPGVFALTMLALGTFLVRRKR